MVRESCLLRKVFGPKKDSVTKDWRKLDNRELHGLYSSSIRPVVKMIKCRKRLAEYVAHMRK
jgi:hypothetical protein